MRFSIGGSGSGSRQGGGGARTGLERIEVRPEAQKQWTDALHAALDGTVWNSGGCKSWYIDSTGRNTTIYPWSMTHLRARLRRFDPACYRLSGVSAAPHRG